MSESDRGDSNPIHRHGGRLRVCVLYEKTAEPRGTARADRVCGRRDGRGVDLESSDTRDESMRRQRQMGVFARFHRFLARYSVPAPAR